MRRRLSIRQHISRICHRCAALAAAHRLPRRQRPSRHPQTASPRARSLEASPSASGLAATAAAGQACCHPWARQWAALTLAAAAASRSACGRRTPQLAAASTTVGASHARSAGSRSRCAAISQRLPCPVYVLPGNHWRPLSAKRGVGLPLPQAGAGTQFALGQDQRLYHLECHKQARALRFE